MRKGVFSAFWVNHLSLNKSICGWAGLAHPYCGECNVRFDLVQMQEVSEACSPDDDMVDGDLGDGMGVRVAPSCTRKKSQSFAGVTETLLPRAERLRCSSQSGQAAWIPGLKMAGTQQRARWKLPHSSKNVCELTLYCNQGTNKNRIIDRIPSNSLILPAIEIDITSYFISYKSKHTFVNKGIHNTLLF